MIQRIQSVYLLIVTGLLIAAMCLPVGQFIASDGVTAFVFKPLGVTLASDAFQSTWGLFGILFLSTVVAFCTIILLIYHYIITLYSCGHLSANSHQTYQ